MTRFPIFLSLLLASVLLAACNKKPDAPAANAPAPTSVSVQDSADSATPPPPAPAAPAADQAAVGTTAPEAGEVVDLSSVRTALNSYMQKTGKTPDDLNDLVKAGYFRALPVAPNGYRLYYDPITVSVSMVKKW